MKPIRMPNIPPGLAKKGLIPAAFLAALGSPLAYSTLDRWEGTITSVYADKLANNIPTFCAGRTDWTAKVGTKLTSDFCKEVDKITLLEYGYAILECVDWKYLSTRRLIGLTIFAINVGKQGACGSQAVKQINLGNIIVGCRLLAFKYDGTPNWSYVDGKYVQGLNNRRQAEMTLCLDKFPQPYIPPNYDGQSSYWRPGPRSHPGYAGWTEGWKQPA